MGVSGREACAYVENGPPPARFTRHLPLSGGGFSERPTEVSARYRTLRC